MDYPGGDASGYRDCNLSDDEITCRSIRYYKGADTLANYSDEFPKRLQQLRERKHPGMSREIISELCGLSPGLLRRYERGEREPKSGNLKLLAEFYDVSADFLLCLTDKEK
jgi:ribosome-binding protein aMBF1 (putative translation factor)